MVDIASALFNVGLTPTYTIRSKRNIISACTISMNYDNKCYRKYCCEFFNKSHA